MTGFKLRILIGDYAGLTGWTNWESQTKHGLTR